MSGANFTLRELAADGFGKLAAGEPPAPELTLPMPPLAPREVLQMLCDIADRLRPQIDPNAWMVIDGTAIVALCSITRIAEDGVPMIGYGTAPAEQGRGAATAAVAGILDWARSTARMDVLGAETAIDNHASQRVLERNGFRVVGSRVDEEDGPLLCWRWNRY